MHAIITLNLSMCECDRKKQNKTNKGRVITVRKKKEKA